MVGEEPDADLLPEDIPFSFTHKHVAKRSLIVAAGPVFNFLLTIIIFSLGLYFTGVTSIRPYVRSVKIDSPAARAGIKEGDRIRFIDGSPITSWRKIDAAVENSRGRPLELVLERQEEVLTVDIAPQLTNSTDVFGDEISGFDLGISGVSEMNAIVDDVMDGMPADKAGLESGDRVAAIDGRPIRRWGEMQEMVSNSKGRSMLFTIRRGEREFPVEIQPRQIEERDILGVKQTVYRIGIRHPGVVIPPEDMITVDLGFFESMGQGMVQSWSMIRLTGYFFVKLAQRKVPMESIGGPIRIAQMAQKEAEQGVMRLLYFIAIISVHLAVLNLLPIPVLDGGHLLFFLIEAIQRRPVSIRTRETAQQIGIFILLFLMVFVFYNDITLTFFE
jgi:regulator of sigma E protease